jgi:GDPmannose 4,6-dehydratase
MLRAVITGVAGQDGSHLLELLVDQGYEVFGVSLRKSVNSGTENIEHMMSSPSFHYIEGDLRDPVFMSRLIHDVKPHEFYNLGAMSHVGHSFENPISTFRTNAEAVIMHLSYVNEMSNSTRYYQASTSEILGGLECPEDGYDENSIINPRSPYAVAKAAAHLTVRNYRDAYGLFACSGILFNHSSERRGESFATRKITKGVASVKLGLKPKLRMGNLSAFRDEGHSRDYVRAMHLMLKHRHPDDYVIATGSGATIEDMFRYVCKLASLEFGDVYELDERFIRPSDVPFLRGNSSKARADLGWEPIYDWKMLLGEMYENDLRLLSEG